MTSTRHPINIRIRDLRRERAMTQEELAEALGISRQSINAMEAGRTLPSLPVAMQIATFFSVPIGTVFGISEALQSQVDPEGHEVMSSLVPFSPFREAWHLLPHMAPPLSNIYQDEKEFVVEFSLPGYKKEEVRLEVGEDFVDVSGTT